MTVEVCLITVYVLKVDKHWDQFVTIADKLSNDNENP